MKSDLWKNLDDKQAQTLTGGTNYCGDEFSDRRPDCLRYDAGADSYENVRAIANPKPVRATG